MLNLCFKQHNSLLSGTDTHPMEGIEIRIFDDKDTDERKIHQIPTEERSIQSLGCVKKLYGGAFSGHADAFREEEQRIVDCFVEEASSYRYLPNKDVVENARRLRRNSGSVVQHIRAVFEIEIDRYLRKLAETLSDKSTPLQWDLNTNTCQGFAEKLLRGLKITNLFHQVPRNYFSDAEARYEKSWKCPRYLLSFGKDIDTPIALLRPSVKSLVWRYYHAKRDYCDMIEYAEQYRTKLCDMPTGAWEVLCAEDVTRESDQAIRRHSLALTDALWTLPRDTLSIVQTHLMRNRSRYSDTEGRNLNKQQWVSNRLRVLHQLDVFGCLCSSLSSAILEEVGKKPDMIPSYYFPQGDPHGTLHVEEWISEFHGLMMIRGRERDWLKRGIAHSVRKLRIGDSRESGDGWG